MSSRPFIHDDFLLASEPARRLYHGHAAAMPIIDYHCHLPAAQVARDERFDSITRVWLAGDHYKWRAMRTNGIAERFCTGDAGDWEKFEQWAATMPHLLGNPLHHWAQLELARYFGVTELLTPANARAIYERCNDVLRSHEFSVRQIIRHSGVRVLCTTDDPTDTLEHHIAFAPQAAAAGFRMLPTWRPDKGLAIDDPKSFNAWLDQLAALTGIEIRDFDSFMEALEKRHGFFHEHGCRLSDHGLATIDAEDCLRSEVEGIFERARAGRKPLPGEVLKYRSAMLHEFAIMDHERGWVQQFHIGALRNANSRMFGALGPDIGCDSIDDPNYARPLAKFLDRLDRSGQLARTILYNANPRDNHMIAAMIGNFQDGSVPGKLQLGSGWWFLDQEHGIRQQLETLGNLGLLGRFVGMLTDSRSFLSYPRHEYFRRILCDHLGSAIERGTIPDDDALVGTMVRAISYTNAAEYFGFGE